jgi:hypothetical protein
MVSVAQGLRSAADHNADGPQIPPLRLKPSVGMTVVSKFGKPVTVMPPHPVIPTGIPTAGRTVIPTEGFQPERRDLRFSCAATMPFLSILC